MARGAAGGPAVTTCFGGGGAFGIAFNLGVAAALQGAGIPVHDGPMLGTSAGAYAAAAIAQSKSLDQIAEAWDAAGRLGRRPALIEATRPLFGDATYDDRVSGVTAAIPTLRRRVLSGAQYVLADIVAASSSPLGLAAPHRIGTSRYVDPGYTHMTSADLAPDARLLVLIAPVAGPAMGQFGRFGEIAVGREMRTWRRRSGGTVLYVRPDRRVAAHGRRGSRSGLLDMGHRASTYIAAYDLGARCAERFRLRHPGLVE